MKHLQPIIFVLLFSVQTHAQSIGPILAEFIGRKYLSQGENLCAPGRSIQNSDESYAIDSITRNGEAYLYVVNNPQGGWVVVSNEQRYWPVLAVSEVGHNSADLSAMIPPERLLYEEYMDIIDSIRNNNDTISAEVEYEWETIGTRRTGNIFVEPLLGDNYWDQISNNDSTLDQSLSYNIFIPDFLQDDCNNDRGRYVGCTAVAVAQIMWYWQWPDHALIANSINAAGVPSADRSIHYYDWESMPTEIHNTTPPYQLYAIAGLLRDVGYMEHMIYTCDNGSAADLTNAEIALRQTFKYHIEERLNDNLENDAHGERLVAELLAGRPVLCQAYKNGRGHTFVIDGYMAPGMYHINWGWGNRNKEDACYYTLDSFNGYTRLRRYDVGIYPDCSQRSNGTIISDINIYADDCFVEYNVGEVTFGTNTEFQLGSRLVAKSETGIRLTNGFHAAAGSNVHIFIDEFPCNSTANFIVSLPSTDESDSLVGGLSYESRDVEVPASLVDNSSVMSSAVNELQEDRNSAVEKFIQSGILYIKKDGHVYNTMGQLIE